MDRNEQIQNLALGKKARPVVNTVYTNLVREYEASSTVDSCSGTALCDEIDRLRATAKWMPESELQLDVGQP